MTQVIPDRPSSRESRRPDFAVPAVQENRTDLAGRLSRQHPAVARFVSGLVLSVLPARARADGGDVGKAEAARRRIARRRRHRTGERTPLLPFRPTRLALGADPATDDASLVRRAATGADARVDADGRECASIPTGELPEPLPIPAAVTRSTSWTVFSQQRPIEREAESTFTQMKGQFLIDRRASSDGRTSSARRVFPALESFRRTTSCWPLRAFTCRAHALACASARGFSCDHSSRTPPPLSRNHAATGSAGRR